MQLTDGSDAWPNIEAGTKIVMRVIFEQVTAISGTYACHLCGAQNNFVSFGVSAEWLTDGSVEWFVLDIR